MEVRIVKVSVWERKRCVSAACFYSPHAFTCFSLPERVTQPDETLSRQTPSPELAKDFGNCQLRNRWSVVFFCFFLWKKCFWALLLWGFLLTHLKMYQNWLTEGSHQPGVFIHDKPERHYLREAILAAQ